MEPKDQLFATLDVTAHRGKLPCGMTALFIDTVGFVSDLPHELVESFSATLEDIIHSVSKQGTCLRNDELKWTFVKLIHPDKVYQECIQQ